MGLPCIVTNINGCNEIIAPYENGLIIPVKDSAALCAAMLSVLGNKSILKRLQTNARPMVVARYEQRVVWDALLAEYDQLT